MYYLCRVVGDLCWTLLAPVPSFPLAEWDRMLPPSYENRVWILDGLKHGFKVFLDPTLLQISQGVVPPNHASVLRAPQVVTEYFAREVSLGRVLELPRQDCGQVFYSPMGLVPKSSGGYRLIMDLSYPDGGLNQAIVNPTFSLKTFDRVVKSILALGPGCVIAKCDGKAAFRQIWLHPSVRRYFAFTWQGKVYIDLVLPMGLGSSPYIWSTVFRAAADIATWEEVRTLCAPPEGVEPYSTYVDDCIIVRLTLAGGLYAQQVFEQVCLQLGIELEQAKCPPPATTQTVLGVVFNTITMTMSIPAAKLQEILSLIDEALKLGLADPALWNRLVGKLVWVSQVLRQGKLFCQGLHAQTRREVLSSDSVFDLHWWRDTLPLWNGTEPIQRRCFVPASVLGVWTDACDHGCGGFFRHEFFYYSFSEAQKRWHINSKELFGVLIAVDLWLSRIPRNTSMVFHSDNQCVRDSWRKQGSTNRLNTLMLREMFRLSAKHSRGVAIDHVSGSSNSIADAFSRNQITRGKELLAETCGIPLSQLCRITPSQDVLHNFSQGH